MKRVTIKDVALRAGVSFAAVSRAFQADGRIAPGTRQKVFEAARELGYRPSPIARGLVRARSGLVTLLIGPTQSAFDVQFFEVLSAALARAGRHLMVVNVADESEVENGLMQALDYKSEAAIVSAGTMSLELSSRCTSAGLPVILAGRALDVPAVISVLAENADGGRQAGALLARVASGPLCFFGNGGRTFADRERYAGFAEAVMASGRPRPSEAAAPSEEAGARDAAFHLLSQAEPPGGVFCANDGLAITLLQAAMLLGLRVPEQLSIVGFDNVPMASWPAFGLTTIDYPVEALVKAVLAAILSESGTCPPITRIPTRLVVRRTTPTIQPHPYGAALE